MERLVILAEREVVEIADLPERFRGPSQAPGEAQLAIPEQGLHLPTVVQEFERGLILKALEKSNWVKSRAARLLNLNRTTLLEKMKKQQILLVPNLANPSQKSS